MIYLQLDATAFGHLATFWYVPIESDLKRYMGAECTNLVDYLERMKSDYWPDWERCIQQSSMDTNWKVTPSMPDKPNILSATG